MLARQLSTCWGLSLAALASCESAPPSARPARADAGASASPAATATQTAPAAAPQRDARDGPEPFARARRVEQHHPPLPATSIALGERWGCAEIATFGRSVVECWDAPRVPGRPVRAWQVSWLRDRHVRAGPDRVCEFGNDLTFRCWQPPQRGDTQGHEVPAEDEWLNPHHTTWNDAYSRSDRVDAAFLGGTFACLQNTKDRAVWCLGDDRFGQLGGSGPVPAIDADPSDPVFVQHLWPAQVVALGTWHACALAAPQSYAFGGHITCWGRGDYGQLGAPAPDRCRVDGKDVACARKPIAGVPFESAVMRFFAGDLYTCLTRANEISCWGASRDGFFGTSGACPAELRRAWPTLHGHVAAPHATCSLKPARVRGVHGFEQFPSAGPRGFCYERESPLRCVGGIRTPRGRGIHDVVVSPGEDASACGLQDGNVVCWGEGYSPEGAPDVPSRIRLEPVPSPSEAAMLAPEDASAYAAACLIHRGCDDGPAPVPTCTSGLNATDWSAFRENANEHVGEIVNLRGAVAAGYLRSTLMACRAGKGIGCCNRTGAPIVLGAAPALLLDSFYCAGDDSAACCNAPAYGDTLVATGRLEAERANDRRLADYKLTGVTLCRPE